MLKNAVQDRPDLIQSELAGLAFDSLQQVFRKADIKIAMSLKPFPLQQNTIVFVVIDPVRYVCVQRYVYVCICVHVCQYTYVKMKDEVHDILQSDFFQRRPVQHFCLK